MEQKVFNLSDQELQQYVQIEQSIEHWSKEHTKSAIQTKRLLSAVESMFEGRMQLMNGAMKTQGFNPAHVHQVHVNTDTGEAVVMFDPSIPNPAAEAAEGEAVSPTAKPASGP